MIYNLDNLCWELKAVTENNFNGKDLSLEEKFEEARKVLIEELDDIISQNKEDILRELEEENEELEEEDEEED